jgi:hypothetical protein
MNIVRNAGRFNVVMCGRRFGKTMLGEQLAGDTSLAGKPVGWFAPTYSLLDDAMRDCEEIVGPLISNFNKNDKRLFLKTGGVIDFWSCDNPFAGRSRAYARVIIDEAGFVADLEALWNGPIRPTLTDWKGDAWFLGTPHGAGHYFSTLFAMGESGGEWKSFRVGSIDNPHIDAASEIESARRNGMPEAAIDQEFRGIPAPDGGCPFSIEAIRACVGQWSGEVAFWGIDLAKSHDWTVAIGLSEEGKVVQASRWQGDWRATRQRLIDTIGDIPALVDSTGVGDPIVEDLQAELPSVEGFKFSSPSKQRLMEGLTYAIQRHEVGLIGGWLQSELESFRYEYGTGGNVRYSAPAGLHDDGVCALALAVQCRSNEESRPKFTYKVI